MHSHPLDFFVYISNKLENMTILDFPCHLAEKLKYLNFALRHGISHLSFYYSATLKISDRGRLSLRDKLPHFSTKV